MRQASHTKTSRRVSPSDSGIDKTQCLDTRPIQRQRNDRHCRQPSEQALSWLLNRRYLGLEIEDNFLAMSKARREEIEHYNIRCNYLERLRKAKIILPPDELFAAGEGENFYGVPWLD